MRIHVFLLALAACTHAPHRAAEPYAAPPRREIGALKGRLFRSLLERGESVEAARLRDEIAAQDAAWAAAVARGLREAAARARANGLDAGGLVPAPGGAARTELDMFTHANDLTAQERAAIADAFRAAAERTAIAERELLRAEAELAGGDEAAEGRLAGAVTGRREAELSAMRDVAATLRASRLDRDYAYRAILREHRRHVPGFVR